MKNTFGNTISLTLFGESHGPAIGAVLDGLPPGLVIDEKYIGNKLRQRRAQGKISTARQEEDRVEFVSGVFEGRTTGTPLCLLIRNEKAHSADYGDGARAVRHARRMRIIRASASTRAMRTIAAAVIFRGVSPRRWWQRVRFWHKPWRDAAFISARIFCARQAWTTADLRTMRRNLLIWTAQSFRCWTRKPAH